VIIGIVGSEAAKFTPRGKAYAITLLRKLINRPEVREVVSGGCHLGGIDIWAEDVAIEYGKALTVFHSKQNNWAYGYMPRNLQIARCSDLVCCITVDRLPESYTGSRFVLCYHCKTDKHVKSGGCWTMKKAIELGKIGQLHIIQN
jgi:hypothetical protein